MVKVERYEGHESTVRNPAFLCTRTQWPYPYEYEGTGIAGAHTAVSGRSHMDMDTGWNGDRVVPNGARGLKTIVIREWRGMGHATRTGEGHTCRTYPDTAPRSGHPSIANNGTKIEESPKVCARSMDISQQPTCSKEGKPQTAWSNYLSRIMRCCCDLLV